MGEHVRAMIPRWKRKLYDPQATALEGFRCNNTKRAEQMWEFRDNSAESDREGKQWVGGLASREQSQSLWARVASKQSKDSNGSASRRVDGKLFWSI